LASAEATVEDDRFDLRRLAIVFAVLLATLLEIIDSSIVNVALPDMMGNLGATLDEIGWVVTGYILSNVIVVPMTSWFASRFGRKRYFVSSILFFTAASVACGFATSLPELVVFRVLQGMGGGALLATSQAIMIESFPASQIGMAQAIFGVGVMIGPSLGPTLGGWITDNFSWRWIFFINLPLGLLAAFMCITALRDPEHLKGRRPPSVDWAGIALLVLAVGSLQMVLERGHRLDWFESREITTFAVLTVLGTIAFVARELTAAHPVVDLRVLKHRSLLVGCTYGTLLGLGLYGSIFLLPVYTQSLLHWTAWQSGLVALPSSIATALTMLVAGRIARSHGPRPVFLFGITTFMVAISGMITWTLQSGWDDLFWPQVARGIGLGAMFVPLSVATLGGLPVAEVPQGAGLYSLFRQLGGSAGVALLATMLEQRTSVHRAQLADQVSLLDAETWTRVATLTTGFVQRGLDAATAHSAALAALSQTLRAQASMLAFSDCYRLVLLLFIVCAPLGFLLRKPAMTRG
jgi:DHA2 family multidrug resistance protein